ncbi:MAG: hypothetical protein A2542_00715 [Parcubacteria group bacterium RIFOXYD2_FULL_52_8]|nr:MAG: hypothetical protein A2542_00715 [Parcubacteria group bacterium RIFOXYD2_FULL_52_8]
MPTAVKIVVAVVVIILVGMAISAIQKKEVISGQPLRVGVLLPLTGKFSNLGEDLKNALLMASSDINKNGQKVQLTFEDSAADPKVAVLGAAKLLDANSVQLIIGGTGSSANLAVAPIMEMRKTPFFPLSATSKLNSAGTYTRKLLPDMDGEASKIAAYAFAQGARKVAILYDTSSDTHVIGKDVFSTVFSGLGGTITLVQGYDSKTTADFRSVLTRVKDVGPDAIYALAIEKVGGPLVKQARELGLTQPLYGFSALESDEFFNGSGLAAEGVVITAQPFSCDGAVAMQKYCLAFKASYPGRQPLLYGAVGYDLLFALALASEKYSPDFSKIIDEYKNNPSVYNLNGTPQLDAHGNVRTVDFTMRIVRDAKFVELK